MRHSRQQIERELRRRIQARVYPAGSRMPSRRELQQELGGSPLTVQAAFDQLAEQGYIVPRGSRGTFVAERLPDESTIALFFNDELEKGSWNRFWSALHRVAAGRGGAGAAGVSFRSYCVADGRADGPVYRQLCTDLEDGALAGVLFTSPPMFTDRSPVFSTPVARVCINTAPLGTHPFPASHIHTPDDALLDTLLRRFRANGRSRIAGLAASPVQLERIMALAAAHGFDARPEWWHWVPTDSFGASASRRIMHLLGTLPPRQRPDCLLIVDDNLVPSATSGILDAGWQPPREVEVAAHANFPLTTHAAVPCLRYGLDAHELLRVAAEEIRRLNAGGAPRIIDVPFGVPGAAQPG